jgi:hypothetical protein
MHTFGSATRSLIPGNRHRAKEKRPLPQIRNKAINSFSIHWLSTRGSAIFAACPAAVLKSIVWFWPET